MVQCMYIVTTNEVLVLRTSVLQAQCDADRTPAASPDCPSQQTVGMQAVQGCRKAGAGGHVGRLLARFLRGCPGLY